MENDRRYIVQPRDIEGLRWLGKQGGATPGQLARAIYGGSLEVTHRRLRAMRQHRLIATFAAADSPVVCSLTRRGATRAGSELPPMPQSRSALLSISHTLHLVDLAFYLEKTERARHLTEREYRHLRRERKVLADLPTPDLVIQLPGTKQSVFCELEETYKESRRYKELLTRYALQNQMVRFYCLRKGTRRQIDTVIAALGLQNLASTYLWDVANEEAVK